MERSPNFAQVLSDGIYACNHYYKFKVKYAPQSQNIADSLSRLAQDNQINRGCEEEEEEYVRFVATTATPDAMTNRKVEEASAQDEALVEVQKSINQSSWDKMIYK